MDKKWRQAIFQLLPLNGRYFLAVALKTLFSWPDLGYIRSIGLVKKIIKIEIKEKKTLINTPRRDTNRYSNCTLFSKNISCKWI